MSDYIPDHLLIEILARLPVQSLLRFKSVCRPWYALITSPSFVAKHLNQSITNSRVNGDKLLVRLFDNSGNKERYLLLNDDDKFGDEYSELNVPLKCPFGYFRVVGSCNGLLCLADDYFSENRKIIIWNPLTRKSVILPMVSKPECPHMFVYGFGAHPITHEYKVIRIKYETGVMGHHFIIPPAAEIYAQGTRSWRGISSAAPPYCIVDFMWSQAYVDGAVHWVAYDPREEDDFHNMIMSFNMAFESFSEFKLPPTLADQPPESLSIKTFGQSLAVLSSGQGDSVGCCIWVMKEYGVAESWTKLFSYALIGMPNKTLGFRKSGEVLLALANSLASYAPESKTLAITGITGSTRAFYVDPFMETLVSVEEREGASEGQLNLL